MARPEKVEQVELLTEKLRDAKVAVLTDYRGLTVAQMQELRAKLRGAQVEFRVVKNTLAQRAVDEAGRDVALKELFKGPVALALSSSEDLGAPIRVVNEFNRANRLRIVMTGGLVEGEVLDADGVQEIADLPPREVLMAQLLGTLQTPIGLLASAVQAPMRELVGLLEAYKDKLGGDPDEA